MSTVDYDYVQATFAALDELLSSQLFFLLRCDGTARIIGGIVSLLLIARRFLMNLLTRIVILVARCRNRFLIFNLRTITAIG